MKNIWKFLILSLVVLFSSCTDDLSSEISASGITETDEYGSNCGLVDQTDWRLDDKWTKQEEDLFSATNAIGKSATFDYSMSDIVPVPPQLNIIAYPNPFMDRIMLSVRSFNHYSIRVIDTNLNVVISYDNLTAESLTINSTSAMGNNQIYRIYYKLYSNEITYRGHGDIRRK